MTILFALLLGYILDLIFGDPEKLYHPIRLIGILISKGEKLLRRLLPGKEFAAGAILAVAVCIICYMVPWLVLFVLGLFGRVGAILGFALQSIWCWRILAAKSLKREGLRVKKYLDAHDIDNSRKYLSYIVGRDTQNLNEKQITKAVVETVAENTSDGVLAPMLFFAIGGAPLAFLYKAVNTMDSMIGYKNEKYILFGRFAAKLDDVFNFIPARITGLCIIVSAGICSLSAKNAFRIFKRDRKNHASPNSAQCESAVAGALGVQLAGDAYYFGKLYKKPTIGDPDREIETEDISRTIRLMYCSSLIILAAVSIIRGILLVVL